MLHMTIPVVLLGAFIVAGNWYLAANAEYGAIDTNADATPITNFAECVAAGYPVLESLPEQCQTEEGRVFINSPLLQPEPATDAEATEPALEDDRDTGKAAAMAAVRTAAAQDLGITEDVIDITAVTEAEWPDGCLGLGGPDEACIMMITYGYEITVSALGTNAIYRTDQTGAVVRKD